MPSVQAPNSSKFQDSSSLGGDLRSHSPRAKQTIRVGNVARSYAARWRIRQTTTEIIILKNRIPHLLGVPARNSKRDISKHIALHQCLSAHAGVDSRVHVLIER